MCTSFAVWTSRDLTNSQHLPFILAIFAGVFLLVGFRKSVSVNLVAFEVCFRRHGTWDLTAQNSQRVPCVSTHSCSNVLVHEHLYKCSCEFGRIWSMLRWHDIACSEWRLLCAVWHERIVCALRHITHCNQRHRLHIRTRQNVPVSGNRCVIVRSGQRCAHWFPRCGAHAKVTHYHAGNRVRVETASVRVPVE